MLNKLKLVSLLLIVFCFHASAQTTDERQIIQFTGLVLTSDSLYPIPYATVYVKGKPYGDFCNMDGQFNILAEKGDTLVFRHVQFQVSYYVVPDTFEGHKYSIIKLLTQDTVFLAGTVVKPMPDREVFDYYFVKKEIPDDNLERARKNLEREQLKEQAMAMGADGKENFRNYINAHNQRNYHAGQIPPMNIMSPVAWAQFFEAWKRGDFKRK